MDKQDEFEAALHNVCFGRTWCQHERCQELRARLRAARFPPVTDEALEMYLADSGMTPLRKNGIRNLVAALQAERDERWTEMRERLQKIITTIDIALGDSDFDHYESDEELRAEAPIQWACKELYGALDTIDAIIQQRQQAREHDTR